MNSCSCSGSRAENASASVRRFRTHSGWPHANIDYVEFVGTQGATVFKDGSRGYCSWDLPETLCWLGNHEIVELPVRKYKVGDRVRIVSGAARNNGCSGVIISVQDENSLYDYRVKHAAQPNELFDEGNLEPLTWKKGDRVAFGTSPKYFGTVLRDGLVDDGYVDVQYDKPDSGSSGYFLPSELELLPTVASKPAPTAPAVRWFVMKPGQPEAADTFRFVEFIGEKGTYHYTDKTQGVELKVEEIAGLPHYVEVYEEPKLSPVKVFSLNTSEVCDVFYTVTDANTQATNSRSKRYESEEAAIAEATSRVNRGVPRYDAGVYVLKATKLVKRP